MCHCIETMFYILGIEEVDDEDTLEISLFTLAVRDPPVVANNKYCV